ncbi:MAG: hypothetical protein FWC03_06110 [Treponema sp.]|nr:hypothetical protein [Treponema sp.]
MNAVIYGAGNIGRGFIGTLFSGADYKITFIDAAENIVNAINKIKAYPVKFVSNSESEEIMITGITAINCVNENEAMDCIAKSDIIATAVGVRSLPSIAPVIAGGLRKRFRNNTVPLNIIICENLINADKYLAELIKNYLVENEITQMKEQVGFVETSIGRMVPLQTQDMQEGNILRICTERYAFLPVNKDAFKGSFPEIKGIVPFNNFNFFIQRKFFIHNMGHALCAYLGLLLGETYIADAASRADILFITQNAMIESAQALNKKFNADLQGIMDHIKDLIFRFNNRNLKDTCERVGADTERKLGHQDRFMGAINCCIEQGITPAFISIGAAAALHYHIKMNALAQTEENAASILEIISKLEKNSDAAFLILNMYNKILAGNTPNELLQYALFSGNKQEII